MFPAIEKHPAWIGRLSTRALQRGHRHYNPALCRVGERLLLAYRVQDDRGISSVGIADLDPKRMYVTADHAIAVPVPAQTHVEDPRLVLVGGELMLFVATVCYGATYSFLLRGFVLDAKTLQPTRELNLGFGRNGQGGDEKNWMPFELPSGGLGLVYSLKPHVVIEQATGLEHCTGGVPRWRWGSLSGRTNAVQLPDGSYLAFIGGHQPHATRKSQYWCGAYRFAGEAPYPVLGISRTPILWASEETPALLNPFDPGWNPLVVFPAGLVLEHGISLLVSLGVHDSWCDFMRFDLREVLAGLVAPDALTGEETLVAAPTDRPLAGHVRVRVRQVQPLIEDGGPYVRGDEFFTSTERVGALGDAVEVIS